MKAPQAGSPQKPTSVRVIVTSPKVNTLSEAAPLKLRRSKGKAITAGDTIVVDPSKRYQKMVGFGAAFTESACLNFMRLSPEVRKQLFFELFHPSQNNLNMGRLCIGSSDFAAAPYSYCDAGPDPELKGFSIAHDRAVILPIVREAIAQNPSLYLLASPWSPPGWMKSNNSLLGGNMQRRYMPSYAQYFVRFINDYASEGVPVKAVTVQNEVDTDQDGNMPQCSYPQEYEEDFVANHLGPALEKAALDVQIWMIDHNPNLWGRALASLEQEAVRKYCKAIAWHTYIGDPNRIGMVHEAHPEVDAYWTEGGPDAGASDYSTEWCRWGKTFTINTRNYCRGHIGWNLALDEGGFPRIGPFGCGGLVTIDSKTAAITRSGQLKAMAHFSRYVARNAVRIDSTGEIGGLYHVAFENPNGMHVIVLTNEGAARKVTLKLGDNETTCTLDADSVTTLAW